jgi:hypothetical protein
MGSSNRWYLDADTEDLTVIAKIKETVNRISNGLVYEFCFRRRSDSTRSVLIKMFGNDYRQGQK